MVNTITATRTRTGLRVEARLDTAVYPTGVSVSLERLQTLPIHAHQHRGVWNYTISPPGPDISASPPAATDRTQGRTHALLTLAQPAITGMTSQQLHDLTERLAPLQAAHAEQRKHQQRGGRRLQAAGAHGRPLLNPADRVVVTIVYLRQICSQRVLSDMLEINPNSISKAIAETRQLLDQLRHPVTPTNLRFTSVQAVTDHLAGNAKTQPGHSLPPALSDPSLTGMSRNELTALIQRITISQAAHLEALRQQRRTRDRLPGTRGGVFRQKINDHERVLATVLHQRGICTRQTLAELFQVSPRTIGNALIEVGPVLQQHGWTPAPNAPRFTTAAALLASVTPHDTPA